jgi:IS605 OrfB family transposase
MIRSCKFISKYQTNSKQQEIIKIYNEYKRLVNEYIKLFYHHKVQFNTETVHSIDSFLSSRYKSNACKQALENIKSIKKKTYSKCPTFNGEMILDHKFVDIDIDNPNSFDLWIRISTSDKGNRINIPLRRYNRFNKWMKDGTLKQSIGISHINNIVIFRLFIEIEDKDIKLEGDREGLDIGKNKVYYTSDQQTSIKDVHKHDLSSIMKRLSLRRKGSNKFRRTIEHRKNYINWTINRLNLGNIKELVIENIKDMKRNRRITRYMSHWTYTSIFDKLERYCQENCVQLIKVNPAYTSQKCSSCGLILKNNRKKETYNCTHCGNTMDADYNASINIKARSLESLTLHHAIT